jgi:hypothetical protein
MVAPSDRPTTSPSISPSDYPTSLPTKVPSSRPSSKPSYTPTLSPSIYPSSHPTKSHSSTPSARPSVSPSFIPTNALSFEPSGVPSLTNTHSPSQTPTKPTSFPSSSFAPTLIISTTRINRFIIVLTSKPNTPDINPLEVVEIASVFLDEYFKENLPSYLRYRGVDLYLDTTDRRQLQMVSTIPCIGEVHFNLFASPDSIMINEHVMDAFKSFKEVFFESLKSSNVSNIQSLLDVNTKDNRVFTEFTSMHVTVIVVSLCLVAIGVAVSYVWKRSQENNIKKRLLRAAEHRQNKGQPQLDDNCFRDLEPQPIQISDDNESLERMVLRSRHDRGVMNRANEMLLERSSFIGNERKREVHFDPILVSLSMLLYIFLHDYCSSGC